MGQLDDMLRTDAAAMLADFGEAVRYRAGDAAPIDITAMIYREPLRQQREDDRRSLAATIQIHIRVEDVPSPSPHNDAVEILRNLGDADPVWIPVTAILAQDPGLWFLAVGR